MRFREIKCDIGEKDDRPSEGEHPEFYDYYVSDSRW